MSLSFFLTHHISFFVHFIHFFLLYRWRSAPFTANDANSPPLIMLGNGQFGRRTWRGKPHGHAKKLRKLLAQAQHQNRLLVIAIDEAYTSQVCSACGQRKLVNVAVEPPVGPSFKLHSVVKCHSCQTMWQRDANAARNMLAIGSLFILGRHLPHVYQEKNPMSRPFCFTKPNDVPAPPSKKAQ